MGYPRLEVVKQCELAPTLLTAMEGKPQPQQDRYTHAHTQSTHPPTVAQEGASSNQKAQSKFIFFSTVYIAVSCIIIQI